MPSPASGQEIGSVRALISNRTVKLQFLRLQYPNAILKAFGGPTKFLMCPLFLQRAICKLPLQMADSHRELLTGLQRRSKNAALQTTLAVDLWRVFGK